jgi:eukaryotic-like serine/threonine-protein kinase
MMAAHETVTAPLNEVITFYSYKGGTGRTMALANVACLFAKQSGSNGRVLAIDWDLEAPGLHYYLRSPSETAVDSNTGGVVEYFTRVQEIVLGGTGGDDQEAQTESVLARVPIDGFTRATRVPNVDLMPAGCFDESYQSRLAKLDWQLLYAKAPAIFRGFARRIARQYDVVLVDSRTGMTDISGICTALLPDKLVVVFTANQQSLTGIERLVKSSVKYRQESRDIRPLLVYPLPSRIDAERDKLRLVWRHGHKEIGIEGFQPQFERTFRAAYGMQSCDLSNYCNEVQVQHSPDYSYGEEVAALEAPEADRFSIVRSYEALTRWLSSSAAPWESPEGALRKRRLEALLQREADAMRQDPTADMRDVMGLQEEIVKLASAERPQHLDTIAAIERLIRTCMLLQAREIQRGAELLRELVAMLPALPSPAKLKALGAILDGTDRLRALGQAEDAATVLKSAMEAVEAESTLDSGAIDVIESLALGLRKRNALIEARTLLELVLTRREQLDSAEGSSTLASMNNLAETLRLQGDLMPARALEDNVLSVRRRVLGEEHPDTLTAMTNLAGTLWSQGDLAGARALEDQVLTIRRRVLGEEHPDTLASMSNLAGTLWSQGDLSGARALQEKVLSVSRRVLGEEHSDTLAAMNNLASTLWAQAELAAARTLEEQVLAVRRRVLGEDHPDTWTAMNNLAGTLWSQGDLSGARELEEQVLSARRRVLGEEHPDTLRSLSNLADTLRSQGDLVGAQALQRKVRSVSERVLGEEHPDTLRSMTSLASTLRLQRELREARELEEQVLSVRRRVLGEEHADTLASMRNLARTLRLQGDVAAARALEEQVS